jgi:hypothetical protein
MRFLLPAAALLGAGCTPPPGSTPPPPESAACNATSAQGLVGRQASPDLSHEAQRLTGARNVRWLRPGQVVTMEFRADRVNLHLDAEDKIERIVCG